MATLSTYAEQEFFQALNETTAQESRELSGQPASAAEGFVISLNLNNRLHSLLDSYLKEVSNNLILVDEDQRSLLFEGQFSIISNCLKKETEDQRILSETHPNDWQLLRCKHNVAVLQSAIVKLPTLLKQLGIIIPDTNRTKQSVPMLRLQALFKANNNGYKVCMEVLEDQELIIDSIPNTAKTKMGKLSALIEVLKTTPGMLRLDRPTDKILLQYFNAFLHTDYEVVNRRSREYKESIGEVRAYIKTHFKNI